LLTKKHLQNTQDKLETKQYICTTCNTNYVNSSGLWKHKKKCSEQEQEQEDQEQEQEQDSDQDDQEHDRGEFPIITNELVMELIKQNKDLQNTLIEQSNKFIEMAKNQSVINNSNNTNNQFNLQFFLNETCKDALNITDFVNSLRLQVQDFENTGKLGYVEGISLIIANGLKQVDETKRPVHCTDAKRETIYIKDKDTWEKETPDKRKLKWAINRVAQMNFNQLPNWQKENPDCFDISTKTNEEYLHLSLVALGGKGKIEEDKFMDKIVRNVLKHETI